MQNYFDVGSFYEAFKHIVTVQRFLVILAYSKCRQCACMHRDAAARLQCVFKCFCLLSQLSHKTGENDEHPSKSV